MDQHCTVCSATVAANGRASLLKIKAMQPDGTQIRLPLKLNMKFRNMPVGARKAYKLPNLRGNSLVSLSTLAYKESTNVLDKNKIVIQKEGKTIIS